jgi:hypothetical protein
MRWPWRRHGRRRRVDAPLPPAVDPWAVSWGETFIPQSTLQAVVEPPPPAEQPVDAPSAASVRLGFSDGTDIELADSAAARAMQALAATLTATRAPV